MRSLLLQAENHSGNIAIRADGRTYTYQDLLDRSARVAATLLDGASDLEEARVAFMVDPGFDYVATQWAIWRAGGVAVPLCLSHPLPALRYTVEDSQPRILVASPGFVDVLAPLARESDLKLISTTDLDGAPLVSLPEVEPGRRAMILYTSGTTSLPKGVVSTHANIEAQIRALFEAWAWSPRDHILCVLPLHHVHGIINVVSCALWSGACCEFLPKFEAPAVFERFLQGAVNLFMAVPTIYFKLITYWEELPPEEQAAISRALQKFRLMVSGSAALPVSVLEKWYRISGHILLERYGMTEIGMALSNPYDGERRPGYVGLPLPGVQVRLVDEAGEAVPDTQPGEIQVRGPAVFGEYWRRPEETSAAFTPGGWFRTGDMAVLEKGSYRILGRTSVDIIKSGGYKISALEIEEALRRHPLIRDCAVVGLPDEEWGEIVAAGLVTSGNVSDIPQLDRWLRGQLPGYKVPRRYLFLTDLPRNALGKVTKNELKKQFN